MWGFSFQGMEVNLRQTGGLERYNWTWVETVLTKMGELKSTVLMANNSIEDKLIREYYLFSLSSQISGGKVYIANIVS